MGIGVEKDRVGPDLFGGIKYRIGGLFDDLFKGIGVSDLYSIEYDKDLFASLSFQGIIDLLGNVLYGFRGFVFHVIRMNEQQSHVLTTWDVVNGAKIEISHFSYFVKRVI